MCKPSIALATLGLALSCVSSFGLPTRATEDYTPASQQLRPFANSDAIAQWWHRSPLRLPDPVIEYPAIALEGETLETLRRRSRSTTVKVLSGETWGSGITVDRDVDTSTYTVLTNDHVLLADADYRVRTPDGRFYEATEETRVNFNGYDLALVQFQSDRDYEIAVFGDSSSLEEGSEVVAVGFPIEADPNVDDGFKFTEGRVSLLPEQSLADGYQIGYTNAIEKGMSGGPVFNLSGEVVAVNGMHAYPLWGDPYIYDNGDRPCSPMKDIMTRSSWAIPAATVLQLVPQLQRDGAENAASEAEDPLPSPIVLSGENSAEVFNLVAELRSQAKTAKECGNTSEETLDDEAIVER